jgi:hypothetical protein
MTVSASSFSIETLTLPHEDLDRNRQLYEEWLAAYPCRGPIEQAYIDQAVNALIETRRIERSLGVLRTEKVRTADLLFDRAQQDYVVKCKEIFTQNCESAMREMTRSAAGCRWCIHWWKELDKKLKADGTWYSIDKYGAIMFQGLAARLDLLCLSEVAYTTWVDCLVCMPNPKQEDIDKILDPANIPKGLRDRDVTLWPGDPVASRARLDAIVTRELERLEALEATLRVQFEEPARAEAKEMAVASLTKQEMPLLRARQMHEQSYQKAVTGLMNARKQPAASRVEAARPIDIAALAPRAIVPAPDSPPTPPAAACRSEHRSVRGSAARARSSSSGLRWAKSTTYTAGPGGLGVEAGRRERAQLREFDRLQRFTHELHTGQCSAPVPPSPVSAVPRKPGGEAQRMIRNRP